MLKSRSGSQGSSSATPPQTIEAVRRRARHRLIGAAVLVLAGVLGFPLLFDTEPRPVAGEIPIEIPARGDASLVAKASDSTASDEAASPAPAKAAAPVSAQESLDKREAVIEPSAPLASDQADVKAESETKAAAKASAAAKEAKAAEDRARERDAEQAKAREAQLAAAAEAKAKRDAAESARAQSLLESKKPAGTERLVVQVGAFSDPASARATRLKVERAGMTTYTHVADTPSGKLIRVRVGPFGSRAEADKAAARVKALGLPARILTL